MDFYQITQNELELLIEHAQNHPEQMFCAEPQNDGAPYLMCTFSNKHEKAVGYCLELSEVGW